MKHPSNTNRLVWIAAQLGVGAVGLAACASSGSTWFGVAILAAAIVSVVAFEVAHRRGLPIAAKLTGVGGDERERSLYREANARTGERMAYVIAVWACWSVAEGKDSQSVIVVAVAYSALWVVNVGRTFLADHRSGLEAAE